jgi:hypothetical protein
LAYQAYKVNALYSFHILNRKIRGLESPLILINCIYILNLLISLFSSTAIPDKSLAALAIISIEASCSSLEAEIS